MAVQLRNTTGNLKQAGLIRSTNADGSTGAGTEDDPKITPQSVLESRSPFDPSKVGDFAWAAAYLGGMFPEPATISYKNIKGAKYNFTDPMEFAQQFGDFNREEYAKNFKVAQDMALQTIDTELQGLKEYAPAAAALKRDLTSADNMFNQAERSRQLDSAMPGVRESLQAQTDRANTYARGELPDSLQDRALELGVRSASADASASGGFGAGSQVARKASDLMSAERRLQIASAGEAMLSNNVSLRAQLELAPTSYSNAGQQINVNPTVSASQLASSYSSGLNNATLLSPATALTATISQEQFKTTTRNQIRQFNANNRLAVDQFNANAKNSFATSLFGYQTAYAGMLAGAAQTNTNTQVALDQQAQAAQVFQDQMSATQSANQAGAISQGVGTAITGGAAIVSGIADIVGTITGDNGSTGTNSPVQTSQTQATPQLSQEVPQIISQAPSAITVPSASAVPPGYTAVGTSPDQGVMAIPTSSVDTIGRDFKQDLGLRSGDSNASTTAALLTGDSVTMDAAGISYAQQPGYSPIGYTSSGAPMYASPEAMSNQNYTEGAGYAADVLQAVVPFGTMADEDLTAYQQMMEGTRDVEFMGRLTALAQAGDKSGFRDAILNRAAPAVINKMRDPSNKAALSTAYGAYNLAEYWDRMDAGSKSLALAAIGMQGYEYATGETLANKVIPATEVAGTEGMTVGSAFNLAASGVNVYALIDNWDQLNGLGRVLGGLQTTNSIAQTAQSLGMLGQGSTGAAVAVDAGTLANAGWQSAGHVGIGAIQAPAGTAIPQGYTAVQSAAANGAQVTVAVPTANTGTVASGTSTSAAAANAGFTPSAGAQVLTGLGYAAGAASVAAGAVSIYKNWGEGGADGRKVGALGGAAIAGGLQALGVGLGPVGFAAAIVGGLAIGSIHTGRHVSHEKRDAFRHALKQNGFANQNGAITLTDGTEVRIDMDRDEGIHSAKDASKLTEGTHLGDGKLQAFDVDYTNDVDFIGSMGGRALMRMLSGTVSHESDQVGDQIGNAIISQVPDGAELNESNFAQTMNEMRAQYSKAGIKSKDDAYQLANLMYADGRVNDTEVVAMHQAFNMIYDKDGFDTAKKLMAGRWEGVKNQKDNPINPYEKGGKPRPSDLVYEDALTNYPAIMTNPSLESAPGIRLPLDSTVDPGFAISPNQRGPSTSIPTQTRPASGIVDPNAGQGIGASIMDILGGDVGNPAIMY